MNEIINNKTQLLNELKDELTKCVNINDLIIIKNTFINKYISPLYAELKKTPKEQKHDLGAAINNFKNEILELFNNSKWRKIVDNNMFDRRSYEYVIWEESVKERDDYRCVMLNYECKGKIELHHVRYRSERKDLINEPNNCVCLCTFHHKLVHSNKKKYQPILLKILENK